MFFFQKCYTKIKIFELRFTKLEYHLIEIAILKIKLESLDFKQYTDCVTIVGECCYCVKVF
jgi:hypothetical protein